jgi:hypothetical protein
VVAHGHRVVAHTVHRGDDRVDGPAGILLKGQRLLRRALDRVAGIDQENGPSLRPDLPRSRGDARQAFAGIALQQRVLRDDVAMQVRGVQDGDCGGGGIGGSRSGHKGGEDQPGGDNPGARDDGSALRRASLAEIAK